MISPGRAAQTRLLDATFAFSLSAPLNEKFATQRCVVLSWSPTCMMVCTLKLPSHCIHLKFTTFSLSKCSTSNENFCHIYSHVMQNTTSCLEMHFCRVSQLHSDFLLAVSCWLTVTSQYFKLHFDIRVSPRMAIN